LQKQAGKILDRRILALKQDPQAFPVLFGNPGLPDETVQLIHDFDPFPFRLRPLLAILADVDPMPLSAELFIRTVASADSTKMSHRESLVVSRARISPTPRILALVSVEWKGKFGSGSGLDASGTRRCPSPGSPASATTPSIPGASHARREESQTKSKSKSKSKSKLISKT